MPRRNAELWAAFTAILIITLVYLFMVIRLGAVPPARELYGHSMGIAGFVLMLVTEVLYSVRKRSRRARWGRMSQWLNFHIFTGIVGPYMVLLHTSWKFNGIAGITFFLTVIIVVSGFIGRYIYTAIPRSAEGVVLEADQIQDQLDRVQADIEARIALQPELAAAAAGRSASIDQHAVGLTGHRISWRKRLSWWWGRRRADPALREQLEQIDSLLQRQAALQRQIASLATARRLLALWHTIHLPIGLALFTAAFIHIFAAIYYATLLR